MAGDPKERRRRHPVLGHGRLSKRPKAFHSATGITAGEFELLLPKLTREYEKTERERLSSRYRKRKIGAGRKFVLPVEDRAVMFLLHRHARVTYRLAGRLFEMDQSTVYRIIQYMRSAAEKIFPAQHRSRAGPAKKMQRIGDLKDGFPDLYAMVRVLERQGRGPAGGAPKRAAGARGTAGRAGKRGGRRAAARAAGRVRRRGPD